MIIDVVIPVYNDTSKLAKVLSRLVEQRLPNKYTCEIIIVNDGSNPDKTSRIDELRANFSFTFLSHESNKGRSAAINTGWRNGNGDYVIIIDADCVPGGVNFVNSHVMCLVENSISFGKIKSAVEDNNFWSRYQNDIINHRERAYYNQSAKNHSIPFTTANVCIKKELLQEIGGFYEGYRHYGFEDRDFLAIGQKLKISMEYVPDAAVYHSDKLDLRPIANKMVDAGQFTSKIFRERHRQEYLEMSYSKIDTTIHTGYRILPLIFHPLLTALLPLSDKLLERPRIPYLLKKIILKVYLAIYFMYGTSKQKEPSQ